jgi:hypothetical protein
VGSVVPWPTHILDIADELARANPSFNKEKFIKRATSKWEERYEPPNVDDTIPY